MSLQYISSFLTGREFPRTQINNLVCYAPTSPIRCGRMSLRQNKCGRSPSAARPRDKKNVTILKVMKTYDAGRPRIICHIQMKLGRIKTFRAACSQNKAQDQKMAQVKEYNSPSRTLRLRTAKTNVQSEDSPSMPRKAVPAVVPIPIGNAAQRATSARRTALSSDARSCPNVRPL